MSLPKVSVVVPAFNSARFIGRSLQSVIDQKYSNVEIICVDDGSTDDTKRVVTENFPLVHYVYQENRGPAAARNLGISKATGEYIAFLDSDDTWLPQKLSLQIDRVLSDPTVRIVHTNIRINANGVMTDTIYPTDHQEGRMFDSLLLQTGSIVCSTLLVDKRCIEQVGGFDEELRTSEDVHLFLKLAYYFDFHFVNEPLVTKYHHDSNLTNLHNMHFGAGTFLALEKIERLFPEYSRRVSKTMRRALYQRAKIRAASCRMAGDYRNALLFLMRAFGYDKTLPNLIAVLKDATKLCFSGIGRFLHRKST